MNDGKRHLLNKLYTGHRHLEFSDMLKCPRCANHVMQYEKAFNKMKHENPEVFHRKEPDYKPSDRTQMIGQLLEERIRTDKAYRKSLEKKFRQEDLKKKLQ